MPYTVQCRSYNKKTVKQLYNYSTVLGAAIQCKPYSDIIVEIGTHLKTVKIILNIFAVYVISNDTLDCALQLFVKSLELVKTCSNQDIPYGNVT